LLRINDFSEKVRTGAIKGYSGKLLKDTVVIGIGGSYLGPEFVFEALRTDEASKKGAEGRRLKFLANVDPIDFARAMEGFNIEETIVVINSKTFTTAETMLNARTVRDYIINHYKTLFPAEADHSKFVEAHMCAVSTNLAETKKFGIKDESVFGFWDWVGGRFSVCSAVGVLPMSLHYGFANVRSFLDGVKSVDDHLVYTKDLTKNIPILLGLIGFYNNYICGHGSRAILPYCQALLKFPAHIQQLDMESNGKTVTKDGVRFPSHINAGPIIFGEPGTNGQHSFYQLMH
jgi:glucose-6-phosphate isomerase